MKHPHAELLMQLIEDTTLSVEVMTGANEWGPTSRGHMFHDTTGMRRYRIKPQPTDGLQNIAAYIGVGGLNGATLEQLEQRIKVEIDRLAAQTLELQAKCADYEAALKYLVECSAPMTSQQQECWKAIGTALAKHGGAA